MTTAAETAHTGPTVDGRIVVAFVDGVVEACGHFEDRARRILSANGIDDPQPGDVYPMSAYLDAVHEVRHTTGPNTLNRIGRAVPPRLSWSPGTETIGEAFVDLHRAFSRAHEGAETGSFEFRRDDDGGVLRVDTPYPDAFEQGLIEGVGKQFGTQTGFLAVQEAGQYRADGGDVRELTLRWWETLDDTKRISPPRKEASASDTDRATA